MPRRSFQSSRQDAADRRLLIFRSVMLTAAHVLPEKLNLPLVGRSTSPFRNTPQSRLCSRRNPPFPIDGRKSGANANSALHRENRPNVVRLRCISLANIHRPADRRRRPFHARVQRSAYSLLPLVVEQGTGLVAASPRPRPTVRPRAAIRPRKQPWQSSAVSDTHALFG